MANCLMVRLSRGLTVAYDASTGKAAVFHERSHDGALSHGKVAHECLLSVARKLPFQCSAPLQGNHERGFLCYSASDKMFLKQVLVRI
jgi:hypothetical protein